MAAKPVARLLRKGLYMTNRAMMTVEGMRIVLLAECGSSMEPFTHIRPLALRCQGSGHCALAEDEIGLRHFGCASTLRGSENRGA